MCSFTAYHAVTDRPMHRGQVIIFDNENRSGVYRRVMEKLPAVQDIYAHPERYTDAGLEHHLCVALRELAMEEVRLREFPQYPSRMASLYVSQTLPEAEKWFDFFTSLGRPTLQVVRLRCSGRCFLGDAEKCFRGTCDKEKNLRLARLYWNSPAVPGETNVTEMLIDGEIIVEEVVKERFPSL